MVRIGSRVNGGAYAERTDTVALDHYLEVKKTAGVVAEIQVRVLIRSDPRRECP